MNNRRLVHAWMVSNVVRFDTATELAESAVTCLLLPDDWLDDETHWIWDEAADAFEKWKTDSTV